MPVIIEGPTVPMLDMSIGQWVKANTIDLAETVLKREVAAGFDNEPIVITDGVPRRDYTGVKPFGKIEFAKRTQVAEAVLWALDRLRQISPVGPAAHGHYRDDHVVLVNGTQVTGDLRAALMNLQPEDRVQIVNPRPYARKLEAQTADRRGNRKRRKSISRQAPNGVYRVVVRNLANRFGKVMFFDFKYVQLNTGVKVWGDTQGKYSKTGKVLRRSGQALLNHVYPALQFYQRAPDLSQAVTVH